MTGTEGHNADHAAVQTAFQDWDFDPETQVDIPRDTLILHLGSFHGWTVVGDGPILGLAPMLADTIVIITPRMCSPWRLRWTLRYLRPSGPSLPDRLGTAREYADSRSVPAPAR